MNEIDFLLVSNQKLIEQPEADRSAELVFNLPDNLEAFD
jgi:hypothetical protein